MIKTYFQAKPNHVRQIIEQYEPCNVVDQSQCVQLSSVDDLFVILDGSNTILDSRRQDYWYRTIDISKELVNQLKLTKTVAHFVIPKDPNFKKKLSKRMGREAEQYDEIVNGTLCTDARKMHNELEQAKNYYHVPGGKQDLQPTLEDIALRLKDRTGLIVIMSGPYVPDIVHSIHTKNTAVLLYYDALYIEPDKVKRVSVDKIFTDGTMLIEEVVNLVNTPGR